jgi:hypothetical protein
MALPVKFIGDTIKFRLQLRVKDQINPTLENAFPLPTTRTIEVRLPGATATVSVTEAGGEIAVIDAALSTLDVTVPVAKSTLLKATDVTVDCIVTDTSPTPNVVTTFEKIKVFTAEARANG